MVHMQDDTVPADIFPGHEGNVGEGRLLYIFTRVGNGSVRKAKAE